MGKVFKYVGIGFGVLVALFLGTILAISLLFDPNDYKERISVAASEKLGHTLELRGPIEANYFPWLGVRAFDVVIHSSNDVSKETLASLDEMSFKVKTMPLLRNEILLDKILIKNAAIHLERDASGKTNWEPNFKVTKTPAQKPSEERSGAQRTQAPDSTSQSSPLEGASEKQAPVLLQVSGIELIDSAITYEDKQSRQKFEMLDITITTKTIQENAPIDISGHFAIHMSQEDNQLGNTTDFSGTFSYDKGFENFKLENVDVKTQLTGQKLPISPLNAAFTGNIQGDLNKSKVEFNDLVLDVDQSHATGEAVFTWAKNPHIDFNLDVDKIIASRYAQYNDDTQMALNASTPLAIDTQAPSPIVHVAYEPEKPELTYKGQLRLGHLEAQKLTFKNINLTATSHSQGIALNPFKADLYEGHFDGESLVNLKNKSTSVKGKLQQIQVGDLLKALSGNAKITGTGNATVNLLVDKRGLNGTTSIQIYKGFIDGVDIDYYLKSARVKLKGLQQFLGDSSLDDFSADKAKDRKRTDYDSITATLYANDNVLTNNDLKLDANDFYALGEGSVDLNKQYIAYKFVAHRKYGDQQEHAHALPLAVRVKGPFNDIKVTPDMDAYISAVVEKEAKGKLEEQAVKQINKLIGGSQDGQNAPKSVEDAIQDKIENELQKKFKKLF